MATAIAVSIAADIFGHVHQFWPAALRREASYPRAVLAESHIATLGSKA